jgi:hypothetical protein
LSRLNLNNGAPRRRRCTGFARRGSTWDHLPVIPTTASEDGRMDKKAKTPKKPKQPKKDKAK